MGLMPTCPGASRGEPWLGPPSPLPGFTARLLMGMISQLCDYLGPLYLTLSSWNTHKRDLLAPTDSGGMHKDTWHAGKALKRKVN